MRRFFAVASVLTASLAIVFGQQPPAPQSQSQQSKPQQQRPQGQEGQTRQGRGQQGQRQGGPPAKPIVPLAASTIVNNPDAYTGQYVSVTAAVEQPLTKSAFSIDQDKTKTEKEILVIAPTLTGTVEANAYVTVLGELVKFDPDALKGQTQNYTLDLSPELIEKYRGKPAVIAKAVVVDATGVDIAKVLPPPLTPEEEAFQKIMRQVGPANNALRGAIEKMDIAAVKEQTAILSKAFTQTEAFWKTRGKPDAVGFATEAKKHADAITSAATAGKWDDVKASAGPLGQQCQSCHTAYRERLDDGSFRIKAGSR